MSTSVSIWLTNFLYAMAASHTEDFQIHVLERTLHLVDSRVLDKLA